MILDTGSRFDRLLQRLCDLTPLQSAFAAAWIYAVWGVAVPIVLHVEPIGVASFATQGTVFAASIVFARAIPFVARRLRRQQL